MINSKFFILFFFSIIFFNGCITPRQHMYFGQFADIGSTIYAVEYKGNFKEINPITDDIYIVIIMKMVFMGIIEYICYLYPENADLFYKIASIGGYIPATLNVIEINK